MSVDVIYDKIHFRHDPKWTGRLGPPEQGGVTLCVACVIEMMESADIACVRKAVALTGITGVLKCSPGALRELLLQDHRVCLHFIASLLGMLHTVYDSATLEKVVQVLVQLLLELQSEQYVSYVLEEIHTQLCNQSSVRGFLPTFTFLGKLVDTVPNLPQSLASQHVPLLERLCSALLYPDEGLKASVLYVWQRVWGAAGAAGAAQCLPAPLKDRVCVLLLKTLAHACSPQLTINCLGFLKQLLKLGQVVCRLMNISSEQVLSDPEGDSSSGQLSTEHCSLPLILKKLLLSSDETLQVASVQCMAAILVHSPSQYCAPFIHADVPEFLFERLSSVSEVLLWSVYSCLLLLTKDALFFSKCHSVYGIESLVRSLKEALRLANLEVQRRGLLLLTCILERQPVGVRLFPSGSGFLSVAEVVLAGVSISCLQVATQAAHAATALLRLNHQSSPVQYKVLEKVVEALLTRCTEMLFLTSSHHLSTGVLKVAGSSSKASTEGGFLLQALACFQAACRLAEHCGSEPGLKENAFTAPSKQGSSQDSLESLCLCLLRCCDTVCIPTVTRHCERAPNAQILQLFYSILSSQFSLLPSLMPPFASKLVSSGFYRLVLQHKAVLCAENRNPALNTACCDVVLKLSVCLVSQPDPAASSPHHGQDCEEMEAVLKCSLASLCCHVSEWPSLLCEPPGLQGDSTGPRATQYCLLTLLHLALQHGDRLLPDTTVFSCVVRLLCSVQEQGDSPLPAYVLKSALFLLAITQDKSPDLDSSTLKWINKALSSGPSFSSLYTHHTPLLHLIFRYPKLAEGFGRRVLELWLSRRAEAEPTHTEGSDRTGRNPALTDESQPEPDQDQTQDLETTALLALMERSPAVILALLDLVCTREAPLAERALGVLGGFLQSSRVCGASLGTLLRPTLLQVLQKLGLVNSLGPEPGTAGAVDPLPLILRLLCLMQTSVSAESEHEMDDTHFKLLYHVSNLAGRLKPSRPDSLLPALSYLYCCLRLSPAHHTDRAVSMLLCNTGLMDQLQAVLSSSSSSTSTSSSSSSSSSSLSPSPALLCCSHLLLSSLITLQHTHSAQVHRSVSMNLDSTVRALVFGKRKMENLVLASVLRLLQAALDVDLESPVLCVSAGPGVGPRPLGATDSQLYPLGSEGARSLAMVLYGLLLQKHELLLSVSVNCLGSLLGFLQRKSPTTAQQVVCQPWSRFLLYSLLNSGDSCLLHPATLTLLALLLRYGSQAVLWEPDLCQVLEAVEKRGLKELGAHTAQALTQLLTQVQCSEFRPPPTDEHRQRAESLMGSLSSLPPADNDNTPTSILRVGELSICLSDFTVKTDRLIGSQCYGLLPPLLSHSEDDSAGWEWGEEA